MIRSEVEYQEAVRRLKEQDHLLSEQKQKLEEMNLGADEVKRAMDPLRSFRQQLAEEVESYDRLKRGEFDKNEKRFQGTFQEPLIPRFIIRLPTTCRPARIPAPDARACPFGRSRTCWP